MDLFGEDVQKAREDCPWEEQFELLLDYKGDTLVLQRWSCTNGVKLGLWLFTQHKWYQNKRLQKNCEAKLEKIGFVWKLRQGNPTDKELMVVIWLDSF